MPISPPPDGTAEPLLAHVGGYSSFDRRGRAKGITTWQVRAADQPWTLLSTTPSFDNPSLLRAGPNGRVLYAVHGGRTELSGFARDPAMAGLRAMGRANCGGLNPVDLGVWPGGGALVVANYGGGTVAVLPLDAQGAPEPPCQVIELVRDGVAGPSLPHGVTFDPSGGFVLIPDKGLDCIFVFALADGRLEPAGFGRAEPGSGPRHAVFHPTLSMVYAVCELSCTVQPFRWDALTGALDEMPPVSAIAERPSADFAAAEIAVAADGRTLYASTRGHDSIAWFALDPDSGAPSWRGSTACLGREPRLFVLAPDGRTLVCANQESDTLVAFPVSADGSLEAGRVVAEAGSPTAICFAPV